MTISCITAKGRIPGQESSMTNIGYTEQLLLTYTLICEQTRKKRNPDTTGKARKYNRHYLYGRHPR